jgi:hypothetical protein
MPPVAVAAFVNFQNSPMLVRSHSCRGPCLAGSRKPKLAITRQDNFFQNNYPDEDSRLLAPCDMITDKIITDKPARPVITSGTECFRDTSMMTARMPIA